MDDRQLVAKLLARDEAAEQLFFRTYRERLYRTCVHVLGYQDPEAEDVVQEAFIIALKKLPTFEFRSNLYTWLHRICVNLCYDRLKKRWRQVAALEEDLENLSGKAAKDRQEAQEEQAHQEAMIRLVGAQREKMGEPCRGLLEIRDVRGESYGAISKTLRIPIGTVMSRLARCRESLKKLVMGALEGGNDV